MRTYIKENLKTILSVTIVLICTVALIGTNEIVAQILPRVTDMTLVSYKLENSDFAYTGEEVKPEIVEVVLEDEEHKRYTKKKGELLVTKYTDNIDCGYADMDVTVSGFQGTLSIKNAFKIKPAQVKEMKVTQENREAIDLTWQGVFGAEGYFIYKSYDSGVTYTLIADVCANGELKYQDTDVQLNANYMYYISAYITSGDAVHQGKASENITQYTPLATPIISSVVSSAYNALTVRWNVVDGAAGYQVYRSMSKDGEFTCVAEISDGKVTTYRDENCQSGITYYYYLKAMQLVEAEVLYGEASQIASGKPTPNRVSLVGSGDDTSVNLSWGKSVGAQGYEVYRSVNGTSNYKVVATIEESSTLNWGESGLEEHTAYFYRIRPYCMVNGILVFGSYSGIYEKEAVIVYDYSGETGADILRQYAGVVPYKFGYPHSFNIARPSSWDCSGFVKWTFKTHFGIELPRTAAQQASGGKSVSKNDRSSWKPGDLIFYKEKGKISHVAVYLGNGEMIHALSSKYGTLIQSVDYYENWDKKTSFYCVKRYF